MTHNDDLRNLIRKHYRRLQLLKEQRASFGPLHTPVHILTEIEDTEAEIHKLQTELAEIESGGNTLTQRVEAQRRRIAEGLDELRQQATTAPAFQQRRVRVVGHPPLGTVEHFKDRVRECEKIGELLASPSTRLVSVIGHGGMGKTALASKVLRDLERHRWPHTDDDIPLDGIVYLSTRTAGINLERLFLDCAKLLDGESEKRLNAVWTNPQSKTEDKIALLLEALKNGRYVILLDNLEDLLGEQGQFVDEDLQLFFDHSLTTDHGARLLVTSRISLAFTREVMGFDRQVKLLEGLPIPDGVALLRELDPNGDYGLRDASEEELAQAVSLVHGVPRALEVIAGILANDPFASLTEVIEQFYEQEDVVQALIEENYKRLDDNARRVIEALAVFKRPVPPLAVDYLLEPFLPGLDVPGILQRLTRTNIVTIDRVTKTVTLHPIDQDYAYSQLPEEGEYSRPKLERRAADYCVQLRTPEETWKTIDDLEPQLTEFQHRVRAGDYNDAGLVLELIADDYLFLWGYYTRLIELRGQLLGRLTDPKLRMANLNSLGNTYRNIGRNKHALEYHNQALALSREIGDRAGEGRSLGNLGADYYLLGQYEQATEFLDGSLSIARTIRDRLHEGIWLVYLGSVNQYQMEIEQAIVYKKEALSIFREIGDQKYEGECLGSLGWVYRDGLGQFKQAIEYYKAALELAHQKGDRAEEGHHLGNLGIAYHAMGQSEIAIGYYDKALGIAREIGDRQFEGLWSGYLGIAYHCLGQMEEAIKLYLEALSIAREVGDRRRESFWLGHLGFGFYSLGQVTRAIDSHNDALAIAREIGYKLGERYQLLGLGKALLAVKEFYKAYERCTEALLLEETGFESALTLEASCQLELVLGLSLLHQHDRNSKETFATAANHCQEMLNKTADLYVPRYVLATALVGEAVCNPHWIKEDSRTGLLSPALPEFQRALEIYAAPGVVQDTIRNLELIQTVGIEGLEPVFELLTSALKKQDKESIEADE